MTRFAGVKKGNIHLLSDSAFSCPDLSTVSIPESLSHIPGAEMIANYRLRDGSFISKYGKKEAKDLRLAIVANYGDSCGIATFTKSLLEELTLLVPNYRIFAERNDNPDWSSRNIDKSKIIPCWKRGEPLSELVSAIKEYDPDIVLVQHEFGIFPNARHWLSLLTQLNVYRVIVELHSTFPYHQDKIIFEGAIEEAIVHLQGAKDNLEVDKGLNIKAHLIGHGCYPIVDQSRLWNNYRSENTFVQAGFGFKYKNFEDGIRAAALLKGTCPNVFFTALFSESPHNKVSHQVYYNELIALIEELGVQDNVAIIRGFQSDKTIDTYFRSNQVAIFPYQETPGHRVFGSSGAVRLAFATGLPTITSIIPHFSDTPSIKATGANQLAEELGKLFASETKRSEQIERQNQFIAANSWQNVAREYLAVFEQGY
jgi:glycosyltransferase involved in cell wall biosynthesis